MNRKRRLLDRMILAGDPLRKTAKELGFSRSTGYRIARKVRGMSVTDAKAMCLGDVLAEGVPPLEAFKKIGVSRATGYRLLKRVMRISPPPPPRERREDVVLRILRQAREAFPAITPAELQSVELEIRKEFGGKTIYIVSSATAARRAAKAKKAK